MPIYRKAKVAKIESLSPRTKELVVRFIRKADGSVEIKFPKPTHGNDSTSSNAFPTEFMMQPIEPLDTYSVLNPLLDSIPILFFNGDGSPCYRGKDPSGHIWYDPLACTCDACEDDRWFDEDDLPKKRKGKKSSQQVLKERYEAGDPAVDLLGEPFGKFDFYVLYRDDNPKPSPPPESCKPQFPPSKPELQKHQLFLPIIKMP